MAVSRLARAAVLIACLSLCPLRAGAAPIREPEPEPDFMHGAGQVVGGVLFELPKTVWDSTMNAPLILGTMVGVFAGSIKALQMTTAGVVEMARGFKPFGSTPRR